MANKTITTDIIAKYKTMATTYLGYYSMQVDDVLTGKDAWSVANRCGILTHAYGMSRNILDAHIQTALEQVFPNVRFKGKKRY